MVGYVILFVFGIIFIGTIICWAIKLHNLKNQEVDFENVPGYAAECKKHWEERVDMLNRNNDLERLKAVKGEFNKKVIREVLAEKGINFEV